MKISKLFHWLYAILMLLPFLVFLPNAFYYGFNEHAVAQQKDTYEEKQVYFNQIIDRQYVSVDTTSNNELINFGQINNLFTIGHEYIIKFTLDVDYGLVRIRNPYVQIIQEGNYQYKFTANDTSLMYQCYTQDNRAKATILLENIFDLTLMYQNYENTPTIEQFNINFNNDYYNYNSGQWITILDKNYPVNYDMSITDSMSYAWDSVWQNDLFSWSYGSFLTEPFIYIGNVFNVPVDNSLYYALSYWLDISIIWLCFDMVMYIPLLVHRWLDKGIIE